MGKGNAVVGQSGGPTSVINSSLAGIVQGCSQVADIDRVFGMRWGIEGFMAGQLVDLSAQSVETIEGLRHTPSSVLGSSRHKLQEADFPRILDQLERHDIHTIFIVGGNDTMDTIHRVTRFAASKGYELRGLGVPKTVDNDLYATDHTPGYPSAARFTALSVQQAGRLARDMQKVDQFTIYQSIGRDAGWLAAAAALAKRRDEDPPHLVYLPERAFDRDRFLVDVADVHHRFGYVSIVCGEGRRAPPLRLRLHRLRRGHQVRRRDPGLRLRDHRQVRQRRVRSHGRSQCRIAAPRHDQRTVRLAGRVPDHRVVAHVRHRSCRRVGPDGSL